MSLFPVFMNQGLYLVGGAIPSGTDDAPDWNFSSFSLQSGDLLIAVIYASGQVSGPSGFTEQFTGSFGQSKVGVYSKTATGSETTFTNNVSDSNVASIVLRNATLEAATAVSGADPASTSNTESAAILILAGDYEATDSSITAPSGYVMVAEGVTGTSGEEVGLHLAISTRSPANEDPGAWTNWTTSIDPASVTISAAVSV